VHLPVDDAEVSVEPLFAEDLVLLAHTPPPPGRARLDRGCRISRTCR
jgi:hypothetical protein